MKQKNAQYFFNKQRQTLKKFNIQEKIHREESKIINDNEEAKNNEIFNDAIQKLAACHMLGFEPLTIIRQKILSKIQTKYNINVENMNELAIYFETNTDDKELIERRHQKQIEVLNKIISDSKLFNYKDVDKNTIFKVKNEIKKYEKDLELKASQNDDEDKINAISQLSNKDTQENNALLLPETEKNTFNTKDSDDEEFKIKISTIIDKNSMTIEDFQNTIENDLKKEIEDEKKMEIEGNNGEGKKNDSGNELECAIDDYNEFKSVILNNLAWKMKNLKKLSDFDNQILLYVTHSIIDELNCAKKNRRDYSFIINPQELIKFLKKFHIQKPNNDFSPPNEMSKKSEHSSPSPPGANN